MPGSTSNLSFDEQQAAVAAAAAAAAKRKEDDAAAAAQAAAATAHREQEALIAAVAAARKTLDEARTRERAAALTWEKGKTIACHLEQQLAAAQGITIPQDDDNDRFIDVGSNPDAALTVHLHVQATGLQNIRSVVTIVLEPSSPDYKR
jgi:pyruvate/2-oxoglutarate dehydrogenase complex dihydrolipoamide acyltransferase (E2) component